MAPASRTAVSTAGELAARRIASSRSGSTARSCWNLKRRTALRSGSVYSPPEAARSKRRPRERHQLHGPGGGLRIGVAHREQAVVIHWTLSRHSPQKGRRLSSRSLPQALQKPGARKSSQTEPTRVAWSFTDRPALRQDSRRRVSARVSFQEKCFKETRECDNFAVYSLAGAIAKSIAFWNIPVAA
jgi:hypothetical protein